MFKRKALKVFIPLVVLLFIAAYAKHRFIDSKLKPESNLKSRDMDETSGLVVSALNPGVYYAHNDSGDTSRFFSIDAQGNLKTTIYFKGIEKNQNSVVDCEDIAVGPGPVKNKSYVYLGDIGDNWASRKYITVYRFQEKSIWAATGVAHANATAFNLKYPDGPKDAEAMTLDPVQKLLYIISKRGDSVGVYTAPLNLKTADTITLTFRGKLFFSGIKPFKWITAADISPDGSQILVRSYEKVYYWRRRDNEPVWETIRRAPRELPYKTEKQGEAIAFNLDGSGYYTTSEGVYAPIYFYKITANK
ncbi:hypothetical protein ACFQZX_06765 [Mucilaginibacter litoreus]|uniref:WD40-like Beta Propeller Repeat n=1 Tax=Mucilaginibacter litoreus TaxID=1048221 RepID=A0ABW3AR44_9SPHI